MKVWCFKMPNLSYCQPLGTRQRNILQKVFNVLQFEYLQNKSFELICNIN